MNRSMKWVITAVILLVMGIIICGVTLKYLDFDFSKITSGKYVTNTYEMDETFSNISIDVDTDAIRFLPSDDGMCKVVCYEKEKDLHNVRVEDNTLKIDTKKNNTWNIVFWAKEPKITVYLPKGVYGDLSINEDTGDVEIAKDFSFEKIDMKLDTGDVNCHSTVNGTLNIKTDTGDIALSEMTAKEIKITSDMGDIQFNRCDAETISVETDTGDVSGTLLSDKVFIAESDTGSVDVPKTTSGGRCEIKTDTGDIEIKIEQNNNSI